MRVCFFGLGSIGRRHLANLAHICTQKKIPLEVHAVRSGSSFLPEDLQPLVQAQFSEAPRDIWYDAIFITNPTSMHWESLEATRHMSNCFFVEKPLCQSGTLNLDTLQLPEENRYYVAAPLRYTSVIQYLCQFCRTADIYSVRSISSSYLPDWRPNTDYRTVYSAKKALGGGVSIDLIHEWDYLTYLFGLPEQVLTLQGKLSHLEIDSEDLAIYIARYPDKFVEVHLDYFGRNFLRQIQLFTKEMTVTGDILDNCIYFGDKQEPLRFQEAPNDKYLREMEYFLSLVENPDQKSTNSLAHAMATLRIASGIY